MATKDRPPGEARRPTKRGIGPGKHAEGPPIAYRRLSGARGQQLWDARARYAQIGHAAKGGTTTVGLVAQK
jgi:hypothetical protein